MLFPDTLSIDILQEDIDASREVGKQYTYHNVSSYSRANSCPAAQSIQRNIPKLKNVLVQPHQVVLETENFLAVYEPTQELISFMSQADLRRSYDQVVPSDDVAPTFVEAKLRTLKTRCDTGRTWEPIFIRALTDK